MSTEERVKAVSERLGTVLEGPVEAALREAFIDHDREWNKVCRFARETERRMALRDAAKAACRYCRETTASLPPVKDRKAGKRCHFVQASNGPPGQDWCAASEIWDLHEGVTEVEGSSGNRREYWAALVAAVRAMDGVQACGDCHPRAPLALDNAGECEGCALRVAEGVERAALDWRDRHDLVKTLAVRFASSYRRWREASGIALGEALVYIDGDVRDLEVGPALQARKAFWEAVRELDGLVPDEEIEKCRSSESASASSGTPGA